MFYVFRAWNYAGTIFQSEKLHISCLETDLGTDKYIFCIFYVCYVTILSVFSMYLIHVLYAYILCMYSRHIVYSVQYTAINKSKDLKR